MHFLHPGARTLQRFADGELTPSAHARASRHLTGCPQCRATVAFSRDLASSLRALDAPAVPSALIERVIAERAAGARAILPSDDTPARRTRQRRAPVWMGIAGIAAAASIALMLGRIGPRAPSPVATDSSRTSFQSDSLSEPHFVSRLFLPQYALAAEPSRQVGSRLPNVMLSGVALRPGRFIFAQRRTAADGRMSETGRGTIDLVATSLDGRAAWRLAHQWRFGNTVETETLLVDRTSLQFLGRTARVAPYRRYREITIRQRQSSDSVLGWMNTDEGPGRPIAQRLPKVSGPYISDAMAPFALAGTRLSRDWTGSLSVLGWAVRPADVYFPLELRVVGEELVSVPAGTFACWRLSLRVNGGTQAFWVRKSDGLGVRSLDESPRDGRGAKETVLIGE